MEALRDAYKQLQQQLGERTIVLGQKAHQIAELSTQLNQAHGLPASKEKPQGGLLRLSTVASHFVQWHLSHSSFSNFSSFQA